ncbi:MAG: HAD family hydrolase [Pirellulaceae bacterium]|nr:HAD family hydrolase [Pirellulaceae bacterium]
MDHEHIDELKKEYEKLSSDGFRVLGIASTDIDPRGVVAGDATPYSKADECDLVLNGYAAFLDPSKETAAVAIRALEALGIAVKVVTGDNDLVTRKVCKEVGLCTESVLLGSDVEQMSDEELAIAAEKTTLFARVSPSHKQRIIKLMSVCIISTGIALPFTLLGSYLGFMPLSPLYWPLLAVTLVCYLTLTQLVKMWLLRKKGSGLFSV